MKLLHEICSLPTAPFVEHHVGDYVRQFAAARPRLRLKRDEHGNILLLLPGRNKRHARWVFTAHMDHPGLVSRRMLDQHTVECDCRGWVLADLMAQSRVRFFDGPREIPGQIIHVIADKDEGRGARAKSARVRVSQSINANVPGMFDLVPAQVRAGKFYSRACDDLAGLAAALAMLDELHQNPPAAPVGVLLTRAEEDGFVGAIAASLKPQLLKKTDRLVAIETSAVQPFAPQGAGCIIRVGDRVSIFNSALTYFLTQQADLLKKRDKSFLYLRALMPGGTCEATVYDVFGFHAASICV